MPASAEDLVGSEFERAVQGNCDTSPQMHDIDDEPKASIPTYAEDQEMVTLEPPSQLQPILRR
jgi:hypothetical protein